MKIVPSLCGSVLRETGFNRSHVSPSHQCDLVVEGMAIETGQRRYDWDNRQRHEGYLFQYTLSGEGRFQTLPDGRPVILRPGTGFLAGLPSNTRYWHQSGTQWGFCYVILNGNMARELANELVDQHGHIWNLPLEHPSLAIIRRIHLLVAEGHIPDGFELAIAGYNLLMELFRSGPHPARKQSPAVEQALTLMEQAFADGGLSMKRIAAAAGCSRYHLSRRFRAETGQSPYATLQQIRIRHALRQLTVSSLAVKEIAANCGYRDTANFCREFKRQTLKTPTEARNLGHHLNLSTVYTA
jgi:AraC-like DNA-binding protein